MNDFIKLNANDYFYGVLTKNPSLFCHFYKKIILFLEISNQLFGLNNCDKLTINQWFWPNLSYKKIILPPTPPKKKFIVSSELH